MEKKRENKTPIILRVALATPLRRCFDYVPPKCYEPEQLTPGVRVQVSFGRSVKIGVLVEVGSESSLALSKLKPVLAILDYQAILPDDELNLLVWASQYYQHSLGEVISAALPVLLRRGKPFELKGLQRWRLSKKGKSIDIKTLSRAPRQVGLLGSLREIPTGLSAQQLNSQHVNWRSAMKSLVSKGLVIEDQAAASHSKTIECQDENAIKMNDAQAQAVTNVSNSLSTFNCFVLDGVTGSGKTEVYLQIIQTVIDRGWQALVLVPEIGLTPQLVARFEQSIKQPLVVLHSGLNDQERMNAWILAQTGQARVVVGTRSAIFTPLPRLGVIIIDEEHDASYKQQEGFRYSARDVAVIRAQNLQIPVVLGSATPSLETLNNVRQERYHHLLLPNRAGTAILPEIKMIDLRTKPLRDGLADALLSAIEKHLSKGGQALLFLNRRGYAPTLLCHDCGWVANCNRCDSHMTIYKNQRRLRCHHCTAERPIDETCPACQSENLVNLGQGTERVEQALQQHFPETEVIRIDRDTTRRKGSMQKMLHSVHSGAPKILVGTQMLAKGHHFPKVTLVGVLGVDHGLFSIDFRASERLAQLIVQVVGRAGRGSQPGQVLIQTHHPYHPLLVRLIEDGYQSFAQEALATRQVANLPPYSYMALLRAEAADSNSPFVFLERAKKAAYLECNSDVQVLGPIAAPMERRAGKYRAQLLVQAKSRQQLQHMLIPWIHQLEMEKSARKVRWSIDVDPAEMY